MTSLPAASASELRSRLEADFRHRVTVFYRSLQITPPYHSVEKAMLALRETLKTLPEQDLRAAAADPAPRNALFAQVFIESGLAKKSRGIITKLLADRPELLVPECRPFAEAFKAPP
ncbi:MAG: hypothetical protein EPO02_03545 [Nitrospirae bacterium]|nr:MAG: hypothetical protein EPO02_03545 [Nitrospirota bacterium]